MGDASTIYGRSFFALFKPDCKSNLQHIQTLDSSYLDPEPLVAEPLGDTFRFEPIVEDATVLPVPTTLHKDFKSMTVRDWACLGFRSSEASERYCGKTRGQDQFA